MDNEIKDLLAEISGHLKRIADALEGQKPVKKKESNPRFIPPGYTEVFDYFNQMPIFTVERAKKEAQRFVDFYDSKNWFVGKTKMKDWKAACRNWASRIDFGVKRDSDY